jgi:hypothetical protein
MKRDSCPIVHWSDVKSSKPANFQNKAGFAAFYIGVHTPKEEIEKAVEQVQEDSQETLRGL